MIVILLVARPQTRWVGYAELCRERGLLPKPLCAYSYLTEEVVILPAASPQTPGSAELWVENGPYAKQCRVKKVVMRKLNTGVT